MQTLFAPAVGLMNRLRYRSKFLLLGMALSVVLGVLLYSVYSLLSRDIYTARNELNGLQMVKPLNRMAQFMQQHRGLSSGVLNGNEELRPRLQQKTDELVQAMGMTGISKSSVSKLCKDIDERVNAFLKRPGEVVVSIGPAIDTRGLSAEEINRRTETWVEGEMHRLFPHHYKHRHHPKETSAA